jgi:Trypsin
MKLRVALSICALIASHQTAMAIANGHLVSKNDPIRPLTVSIYSHYDDCTGVKIASNLILTAKHCRVDKPIVVIFADGSSFNVVRRFTPEHKRMSYKNEYDLAILMIDRNVAGPVAQMAGEAGIPANGLAAWMAGYGGQQPTKSNAPLRKIQIEVTDRNYAPSAAIARTRKDSSVCDGDSGGPAYRQVNGRVVVWGIDSAPLDGESACASREVYAKVAAERDWIRKIIAASHPIRHGEFVN